MSVVGRRVLRFGRVASTMEVAAGFAAAGEPEGLVVVADEQTAGRGRAGRSWHAPPGSSLLLTVLLRPDVPAERLPVLAPLAGVALAEAVEGETGLACWLKWPNDLWLGDRNDGRKAAGILAASRLVGDRPGHVLLGIGLNVTTPPAALPPGATSLLAELGRPGIPLPAPRGDDGEALAPDSLAASGAAAGLPRRHAATAATDPPDRERVLAALLPRLDGAYAAFVASGGRPSLDGWRTRAALPGEPVVVEVAGEPVHGVHEGIDDDGALLLRQADGGVNRIVAGELTRGPRRR